MNKTRGLSLLLILATGLCALEVDADPRTAFFEGVAGLCGATFEGTSSFPSEGPFVGRPLVATVAGCTADEIRIPFAVGDDHSRTWILTRSAEGLLLKHDHRHEDGTPDEITMYGGWATEDGTELSQAFAADEATRQLIPEAATNVWRLTLSPNGGSLTYDLERHSEPRFEATLTRRSVQVAD